MIGTTIASLVAFCFVLLLVFFKFSSQPYVVYFYKETSDQDINKILLQHLMPKGVFVLKLNDVEYMISHRGRISLIIAKIKDCKLIIDNVGEIMTIDLSDDKEDLNKIKKFVCKDSLCILCENQECEHSSEIYCSMCNIKNNIIPILIIGTAFSFTSSSEIDILLATSTLFAVIYMLFLSSILGGYSINNSHRLNPWYWVQSLSLKNSS